MLFLCTIALFFSLGLELIVTADALLRRKAFAKGGRDVGIGLS